MAARQLVKELIWLSLSHRPQGRGTDIFLLSSRRSGGTLLTEVIAANRGVRSVGQPDSIYTASSWQIHLLPIREMGELINLEEEERRKLHRYLEQILQGKIQINVPWRFWTRDFEFVSDRLVLKMLECKPLIEWLAETFDASIVYATRHPIPAALSTIRNGWGHKVSAYLHDEQFVGAHLDEAARSACLEILRAGTSLEQHVLSWGLENLIPAQRLSAHPEWLHISHEETVCSPGTVVEKLSNTLALPDTERMLTAMRRPSRTSRFSTARTRTLIRMGAARELISSWRSRVSADEERRCFEILQLLGVDLYRFGEDLPADPHLDAGRGSRERVGRD